jgi:hypothetical protein
VVSRFKPSLGTAGDVTPGMKAGSDTTSSSATTAGTRYRGRDQVTVDDAVGLQSPNRSGIGELGRGVQHAPAVKPALGCPSSAGAVPLIALLSRSVGPHRRPELSTG